MKSACRSGVQPSRRARKGTGVNPSSESDWSRIDQLGT
jgi:hypothetical protein